MIRKDKHQRKAYALRRMSLAVDRLIVSKSGYDKHRASRWVLAWACLAGVERAANGG